jgi:hypothetical protein
MSPEVTGRWEELVSRPEFRGHQVRITIVDQPPAAPETDDWLKMPPPDGEQRCADRPPGG